MVDLIKSPFDLGGLEKGVLGVSSGLVARFHVAWLVVRAAPGCLVEGR